MSPARRVETTYLVLLLLHTLAASTIWGINTLFLLDAGLTNAQAFGANAFWAAGLVLFEVPTGVLADTRGRRASYLLGTLTLIASTLLYLAMWRARAPFWAWALASLMLGLGFTFFSGAVEAWLVDALAATGFDGKLEHVLARGTIVTGGAMLVGSVGGGLLAEATNLGMPYLLRALLLTVTLAIAWLLMHDVGFTPKRDGHPLREIATVIRGALEHGLANPPVRWVMLAAFFVDGVMFYAFYAMQPYLLELHGSRAYGVAGLAAAAIAGAQIAGGLLVPHLGRIFRRRTTILISTAVLGALTLAAIGLVPHFWTVIALIVLWALLFAASEPVRQAYLNGLIPSAQRATVISFDALLTSGGGAIAQPALGRMADVWGYPASYLGGAAIQTLALPFLWLARRERAESDPV